MKKIVTIILILFVLIGALLVGAILRVGPGNFLGNLFLLLSEDTAYASGYSERAFQKIALGDSASSVRAALGEPLDEYKDIPYLGWLYAPEPHPAYVTHGDFPDMRYSFTEIRFGTDRTFDQAFGQLSNGSQIGLGGISTSGSFGSGMNSLALTDARIQELNAQKATPEQIETLFGKPREVFESRVVNWLQYSHSPGSKNYRQRIIGIDKNGKVCRKIDRIYWD